MDRTDAILARLRGGGGRATAPRRALVEALLAAGRHVSAEELADAVRRRHPEVHRSTVYRALDALEQAGVVEHVHLGHGPATYHLAGERHLHLLCDGCGAVVEVADAVLDPVRDALRRQHGFHLDGGHFALPGRCRACGPEG